MSDERLNLDALCSNQERDARTSRINTAVLTHLRNDTRLAESFVQSLATLLGHPALVVVALAILLATQIRLNDSATEPTIASSVDVFGFPQTIEIPSWLTDESGG